MGCWAEPRASTMLPIWALPAAPCEPFLGECPGTPLLWGMLEQEGRLPGSLALTVRLGPVHPCALALPSCSEV